MQTILAIPLPSPLKHPLPPVLSFNEVVAILEHWNLGAEKYVRELREVGVLVSVNEWPHGQRARYASMKLPAGFVDRHPSAKTVIELYPIAAQV